MKKFAVLLMLIIAPQLSFAAEKDIVDVAVDNGIFTTLASLLGEAGLVETLKGEGPFTVFAPTDEAFAKVPKETLASLKADKEKLAKVLKYHVVSGKVTAAQASQLESADTVAGEKIKIDASEGVMINDATVVTPDVMASNGVIHVIDTVLIPSS